MDIGPCPLLYAAIKLTDSHLLQEAGSMTVSQKAKAQRQLEISRLNNEQRARAAQRLTKPGPKARDLKEGWQERIYVETQKHGLLSKADIAMLCGIAPATLRGILNDETDPRHNELKDVVDQARSELRSTLATYMLELASKPGNNRYQAAQWCLTRFFPDEFGDKANPAVNVNINQQQLPAPLDPEQYAKLFEQQRPAIEHDSE
jgi:hypothetical protein